MTFVGRISSFRAFVAVFVAAFVPSWSGVAAAQPVGHVSVQADWLPNVEDTVELRARVFAEQRIDAGPRLSFTFGAYADGLVADRAGPPGGAVRRAIVRPQNLFVEARFDRFDLRAGYARIVWGRLDEVQPGDVVNPLDVSRFFFEGRAEARLPVPLVRGRVFAGRTSLEGVYVPAFRPGRFDQLAEESSPFNLAPAFVVCLAIDVCAPAVPGRREPRVSLANAQGGARATGTAGRVDWGVSAYTGFEPFGLYRLAAPPHLAPGTSHPAPRTSHPASLPPSIVQDFPRFVMMAGDFETVRGPWGLRGEVAAFVRDHFQREAAVPGPGPALPVAARGSSVDAGLGFDRRAGDYRLAGTVLLHREAPADFPARTDVSLVAAADRSFARDTRRLRLFGVYNLSEQTGFLRSVGSIDLRDGLWLELSGGLFAGSGPDVIGRLTDRDFLYVRLRAYF